MATDGTQDGRRARRARNRLAVIDATFELVQEGKIPPQVDDVADRAGVSASSIFRNFDGVADVQRQALEEFQDRFAHLFVVEDSARSREQRIRAHVGARIELATTAGGLIKIARSRALDHDPMLAGVARLRDRLADQVRARFAPEVDRLTPARAANLIAIIDATTSPEAFEVMSASHARSPRQIAAAWTASLDAMITSPETS